MLQNALGLGTCINVTKHLTPYSSLLGIHFSNWALKIIDKTWLGYAAVHAIAKCETDDSFESQSKIWGLGKT